MGKDIPADEIWKEIRWCLTFPYPRICRHLVACDMLSLLEKYGHNVSYELAGAVVRAEDDIALGLLPSTK